MNIGKRRYAPRPAAEGLFKALDVCFDSKFHLSVHSDDYQLVFVFYAVLAYSIDIYILK